MDRGTEQGVERARLLTSRPHGEHPSLLLGPDISMSLNAISPTDNPLNHPAAFARPRLRSHDARPRPLLRGVLGGTPEYDSNSALARVRHQLLHESGPSEEFVPQLR